MIFNNNNSKKGGVKEMFMVSLPMVLSTSFDTFLIFINRLFLSKLGSDYMNASLIGGTMEGVTITFFCGIIGYSAAMVAQNFGAQKTSRCSLVLVQAFFIAICSYPITIGLLPIAHSFLNSFDVPATQSSLQIKYFDVLIYGCIITMLRHSLACFFIGLGKTRIVMISTLIGLTVTLFLSYGFTFGNFGLPALNIYGAPLSVIIGNFTALCFLFIKFLSKEYIKNYATNKCWRLSKKILTTLIKKGIPSGSEMFLNMLAFTTLILLFDTQGTIAATATSIMFNWDLVSFVPLVGLGIGATSLVGKYVGARDFASAKRVPIAGIKIGLIYSLIIIILFIGIPGILVDIFEPHSITHNWEQSKELAIHMLRLAAIYVTVEIFLVIYAGCLRGAGDTLAVMFISSGLHWATTGVAWFFFNVLNASVLQTWGSTVLIFIFFPIFLFLRWKNGKWKATWE